MSISYDNPHDTGASTGGFTRGQPEPSKFESWSDAYERILEEVQAEMPDTESREVFAEYKARCEAWKRERGIRG